LDAFRASSIEGSNLDEDAIPGRFPRTRPAVWVVRSAHLVSFPRSGIDAGIWSANAAAGKSCAYSALCFPTPTNTGIFLMIASPKFILLFCPSGPLFSTRHAVSPACLQPNDAVDCLSQPKRCLVGEWHRGINVYRGAVRAFEILSQMGPRGGVLKHRLGLIPHTLKGRYGPHAASLSSHIRIESTCRTSSVPPSHPPPT